MANHTLKESLEVVAEYIGGMAHTALDAKQDICRVSVLPVASVDYKNVLYQYIGPTTREYIHNYYYECALDGNSYVWVRRDVYPTNSRKILVPIPDVTVSTYTYNGEAQGPVIKGLELPRLNITNETATNAGEYSLITSLKNSNTTVFEDGKSSNKIWDYKINKASQTISTSVDSIRLNANNPSVNIIVDGLKSSLTVSGLDSSIATCTIEDNVVTLDGIGNDGNTSITIQAIGNNNYIESNTITISITAKFLPLKKWGELTDAELVKLINAADRGEVDLYEDAGWRVGDERTVTLSAMGKPSGIVEAHAQQQVTFVLLNKGGYNLVTPTESGRTTCSFVVGLKDCLKEVGNMTNVRDTYLWNGAICVRRNWCNTTFKNSIPESIRSIFKQVNVVTAYNYKGRALTTTQDYFFFPAAKEVFGGTATSSGSQTSWSCLNEFNALSQFSYYQTKANRKKKVNGSYTWWFERSPRYDGEYHVCCVDNTGDAYDLTVHGSDSAYFIGIAPIGCI